MRKPFPPLLLPALVLLALVLMAATGKPELPDWFVVVLGAVLPWLFQSFICKLPPWAKAIVSYGIAGAVAVAAGFLFAGWHSLADLLRGLAWLWATLQFVYDLMVRPVFRYVKDRKTAAAERARR